MVTIKAYLIVLCCVSVVLSAPLSWTELSRNTLGPLGRWNSGIAFVGSTGYVFGGQGTMDVLGKLNHNRLKCILAE